MNMLSVIRLIGVVFFLGILPVLCHALTPGQVFDKVKDAVVVVKTQDADGKLKKQGSGVILPSGKVATNCHVVEGGSSYKVGRGKQLVTAILYAEDGNKDICILDAKGMKGKPAHLGKAVGLKVGDTVYAVGAPQGLELSLSDGIVAQLRGSPSPLIQTTAAISPGSSGGGLFDRDGRLVGLTTFYVEGGQSLNFAMPVEWISEVKPGRKLAVGGYSQSEFWKRSIANINNDKELQRLLDWCQKWTKSDPENADAWYSLGVSYSLLNRYNDAIEAHRQALSIDPENADAWYGLGNTYGNLDRYNEAIEAYRQVLRINPEYGFFAWNGLGDAYHNLKRDNEAIEAYLQAVRILPEFKFGWRSLGNAYSNLKLYDDAIEAYRHALRIDPKDAFTWARLGNSYRALKRSEDAIEAHRQALHVDPKYAYAWTSLGDTYRDLKRYDEAIANYRSAQRLDPKDVYTWQILGITYGQLNRHNEAIEVYRQLLRINPEDADAWFGLGDSYGQINRDNDAVEAYRQGLSIDPENASAWYMLGLTYAISGNRTAALNTVRELRRLDPVLADKLFNRLVPR
jgi:tetratricopeptide (TPR) repeat protein